jgi:hypothetical protein
LTVTDAAVKLIRRNEYAVHKLIINRPRIKLTAMALYDVASGVTFAACV